MQFIQKATDRSWNVGHSLQSQTSEVKAIRVHFSDGISLVLVDTPGFDDTNKSDLDILKIIARWFEDVYVHRCRLYHHIFNTFTVIGMISRFLVFYTCTESQTIEWAERHKKT